MHECDYCGATHDSERAHHRHLKSEHRDELGPIDRRRVGDVEVDDDGIPTGPIALGVVLFASLAIVGYVVFLAGSGGASGAATYSGAEEAHTHGTIQVVVDGEAVDFQRDEFIMNDNIFHFHGDDGEDLGDGRYLWHVHGYDVTIQYALSTLGIDIDDEGTELSVGDTTYDADAEDTDITVTVDDESVEPGSFDLSDGNVGVGPARQGDGFDVSIVVETDG